MSHNIEIVAGKAQHVYVGDVPWHGLGTRVPYDLTPEQMLEAAGLDWEVQKIPLSAASKIKGFGNVYIPFKDHRALIRVSKDQDKMQAWKDSETLGLSIVGKTWNPIQNSEQAEFFHDFVMKAKMNMHTAGSLQNGRIVWMLAEIKDHEFEVVSGDAIQCFMLFSNFHFYGKKADIRQTSTRVVCNNTFDIAMSEKSTNSIQVDHRRPFDVEKVKETLKVNAEAARTYKEKAQFLASKKAQWTDVKDYFMQVEPAKTEKKLEDEEPSAIASMFIDAFEKQPGSQFAEGSWWQAFNATTYAYDHMVGRKKDSEVATRDNRMVKSWYGDSRKKKMVSLDLALDFAKAA